jgi:hypothetical protein
VAGCQLCGAEAEGELCSKCLERLHSTSCPFCGEPLRGLRLHEGLLKHPCGARFHPTLLSRALKEGFRGVLREVCDEYRCEGDLEECCSTCDRVREFIEVGVSKIKPILEPALRDAGVEVEYGWKTCLIRDGGGMMAVLIDQHNPTYLSEGASTIAAEGPGKATIIGAGLTERQVKLIGAVEEALRRNGYVDIMKAVVELPEEMGTVEAP